MKQHRLILFLFVLADHRTDEGVSIVNGTNLTTEVSVIRLDPDGLGVPVELVTLSPGEH
jgi:hypothetical protein